MILNLGALVLSSLYWIAPLGTNSPPPISSSLAFDMNRAFRRYLFDAARRLCYRRMLRPSVIYDRVPLGTQIDDVHKGCDEANFANLPWSVGMPAGYKNGKEQSSAVALSST